MQLSMTVLRCPDQVAPETRSVSGGEFHVGRGPDVDWVLPDPDRLLSKRHFAVAFRGGGWQVADTSTNGTYLNTDAEAIGRGTARSLRDGDRLRLGAYEIEVRVVDQPEQSGGYSAQGGMAGGMSGGMSSGSGQSPFGDPFGDDPLAPAPAPSQRRPFDEPYSDLGRSETSSQLPHDFDPLGPDDGQGFGGGFQGGGQSGFQGGAPSDFHGGGQSDFHGRAQSDHSSSMEDAMIAPSVSGYSSGRGGIIPADDGLPDDWDKDLLEGIAPPASPAPPAAPPPRAMPAPAPRVAPEAFAEPAPEPAARAQVPDPLDDLLGDPLEGPFAAPSVTPVAAPLVSPVTASPPEVAPLEDPFGDAPFTPPAPAAFVAPPEAPAPAPVAPAPTPSGAPVVRQLAPRQAVPPAPALDVDPFDEPELDPPAHSIPIVAQTAPPLVETPEQPQIQAPAPRPMAAPPRAQAADEGGLLEAFFKGAQLTGASSADPAAMMSELGTAFRAVVSGLRAVLIARATIKSEFRIEQTMIRARGNNPLKFSANDDDALTALLGVGRRTDMTPTAAVEDSLRDLRLHEVAVMAAMQVAVRSMLDELSPDKVRAGSDQGGMAVLPAQRKARAWDAFEARHAATTQALMDDFDSVFGKSFARAYERALDEISTREQR
jgi:predicted component of type VI protein secretion system